MPELFSVNEAAAIAEVSPETIRMALEKKSVVPAGKRKTGKTVRYQFSIGDVRFIKVLDEFPFPLSKRDKQCLAQILAPGKKLGRPWSMQGPDLIYSAGSVRMSFQCKTIRETVDRNAAVLRWGKKRVVSADGIMGGEPVFRGGRIPLRHVASLFRKGVAEEEIREDFPRLNARDLAYARLFSRCGEKPGRPRKRLKLHPLAN